MEYNGNIIKTPKRVSAYRDARLKHRTPNKCMLRTHLILTAEWLLVTAVRFELSVGVIVVLTEQVSIPLMSDRILFRLVARSARFNVIRVSHLTTTRMVSFRFERYHIVVYRLYCTCFSYIFRIRCIIIPLDVFGILNLTRGLARIRDFQLKIPKVKYTLIVTPQNNIRRSIISITLIDYDTSTYTSQLIRTKSISKTTRFYEVDL